MARSHFRLLDLPPELRLRIYEYVYPRMVCHFAISRSVYVWRAPCRKIRRAPEIPVALLRASRLIYEEARSVLYKQIIYDIDLMPSAHVHRSAARLCWLHDFTLGPHVQNINPHAPYCLPGSDLRICDDAHIIMAMLKLLNKCQSFRRLHVELRIRYKDRQGGSLTLPYFETLECRGEVNFSLFNIAQFPHRMVTSGPRYRVLEELASHLGAGVHTDAAPGIVRSTGSSSKNCGSLTCATLSWAVWVKKLFKSRMQSGLKVRGARA